MIDRDKILQMARECGFNLVALNSIDGYEAVSNAHAEIVTDELIRFAHLVEQRTREECARICEERLKIDGLHSNFLCAKFIRATS